MPAAALAPAAELPPFAPPACVPALPPLDVPALEVPPACVPALPAVPPLPPLLALSSPLELHATARAQPLKTKPK
jgi:hypothetical protein